MKAKTDRGDRYDVFRPWFYAAAIYNLLWGSMVILSPSLLFDLIEIDAPNYLPLWQVVGMFVLVFAPAYWWAARLPERHPHLIVVGMLGKLLGPLGFAWAVIVSDFPLAFGVTILTNDLIWYPAFFAYIRRVVEDRHGWRWLVSGE